MPGAAPGWTVAAALVIAAVALSACVERERAFLTTAPRGGPAPPGALAAPAPVPSEPPPVPAPKPDRPVAAPVPPAPPAPEPLPGRLFADRFPDLPPPAALPAPEPLPDRLFADRFPDLPPPPAEEPGIDPRRLIGLSFAQMAALLGQPTLQSERPPAKTWTYDTASCALTIFFYPDIATREFRALTYELKTEIASEAGQGRCLRELRPRAAALPWPP